MPQVISRTYNSKLQHTATIGIILQHRPWANSGIQNVRLHHTASRCNTATQATATQATATQAATQATGNQLHLQHRKCAVLAHRHSTSHCNTLQLTATHCNTLQHTATHCNTLQHRPRAISRSYNTRSLQYQRTHTAHRSETHCNTLQLTATHCNSLQHRPRAISRTYNTGSV